MLFALPYNNNVLQELQVWFASIFNIANAK